MNHDTYHSTAVDATFDEISRDPILYEMLDDFVGRKLRDIEPVYVEMIPVNRSKSRIKFVHEHLERGRLSEGAKLIAARSQAPLNKRGD